MEILEKSASGAGSALKVRCLQYQASTGDHVTAVVWIGRGAAAGLKLPAVGFES